MSSLTSLSDTADAFRTELVNGVVEALEEMAAPVD